MAFNELKNLGLILLIMSVSSIGHGDERAGSYYRYTMPDGRTEVGRQVPSVAVDSGYEVLDKRMRVIWTVKSAPTAAELAVKRKATSQQHLDEKLLQIFATSEDAERARDRKISALDVIVNISKGNILRLNIEYETLAALAASKLRRGQVVPEHVQSNMVSIERQIQEAQAHIRSKEIAKSEIFDGYQPDILRLRELEGKTAEGLDRPDQDISQSVSSSANEEQGGSI